MYDATFFSYGIHHNHAPALRQFLLMQKGFLNGCGLYLKSELVTIDPIERRAYQHLEYKPWSTTAPTRRRRSKILNAAIRGQYQQFLRILSQKPALDDGDMLSTAYYLFLQDRAHEAHGTARHGECQGAADAHPARLLQGLCRLLPRRSRPPRATIARRYADYPVDRWRERFAAVAAQADEIEGKGPSVVDDESRDQQQEQLAAKESTLDLKVEDHEVKLNFANLDAVTVNYHEMDLEFLFSTNPFVSSDSGGFSIVRPNRANGSSSPRTATNTASRCRRSIRRRTSSSR